MAVDSFSALKQYIINRLARSDYADTQASEDVAFAEAAINRQLRVRAGLSDPQTLNLVGGQKSYTLDADFLQMFDIGYASNGSLKEVSMQQLVKYPSTGQSQPNSYAIGNRTISFYPTPDAGYEVNYSYIGKVPALSDSNTSNWMLEEYPDVYIDCCLYYAYKRFRDARADAHKLAMDAGLNDINSSDKSDQLASAVMEMQHNVSDRV